MKRMWRLLALAAALASTVSGCVSPVRGLFPAPPNQTSRTVYVLHRGLHTGVIIQAADIPRGLWPEHQEFLNAQYLEVGWGDSHGYRFPLNTGIVLRAMFASKASVLLIHAFSGSVTNEYAGIAKEIIAVQLSETGFARLCTYIHDTYALDSLCQPIPLPTVYSKEHFFAANGHYSAFNNCNNWTARALRAAGCPIRLRCSLLPGIVFCQTRLFGQVIWPPKRSDPTLQHSCASPSLPNRNI